MKIEELNERKTQIETTFEQLTKQSQEIEQEKLRLQGEYRTVVGFIEQLTPKEPKAKK